jgi:hypothetical protein
VSGKSTMIRFILYNVLLFGACGYALARGKTDARIVALACLIGSIASFGLRSHLSGGYGSLETGIFLVDVLDLLVFTYAALISDRFWPLWISGLQLTTSFGHIFKWIDPTLLPLAYAAALRFWGYPILIILLVATWRQHRRSRRVSEGDALPC